MFNRDTITPIARKTQELHQDASETLALQEGLRMHQASFKHFKRGLTKTSVENQMKDLDTRLDYIFELLDFYETTCDSIIQQQKNLQSLAFNLETVRQSRAVARLNTLAIVFLPISFIASIFGITTITIPAYWYPVAAIPTLLVTCTIAFVISASSDVGGRICSRMKIFSLPYHQCPPFSWRRRHIGRVDRDLQRRIDENLAAMELAWAAQPVFYQCTTTMPYERAQDQH
ncbi:hypothetical protein F4777DRAFT_560572 [Nemania sp. FL0916]|nr:hypothetical protein F4777DRAFT_560572 [Nemania sp. FL0916]